MEIILIIISITTLILLKIIFNFKLKDIKSLNENDKLNKLTEILPDNKIVCKSMLQTIKNTNVKIEENKSSKTSFYFVTTNTIKIVNTNHYSRILTIAHECIHVAQDKKILLFNFIFSNVYLIYYILTLILTITKVYTNINLQISILLIFGLIHFCIRSTLEMEAIIKSKYLAKEYLVDTKKYNAEEITEITEEYEKINSLGIKVINYQLISGVFIKLIIYLLMTVFV